MSKQIHFGYFVPISLSCSLAVLYMSVYIRTQPQTKNLSCWQSYSLLLPLLDSLLPRFGRADRFFFKVSSFVHFVLFECVRSYEFIRIWVMNKKKNTPHISTMNPVCMHSIVHIRKHIFPPHFMRIQLHLKESRERQIKMPAMWDYWWDGWTNPHRYGFLMHTNIMYYNIGKITSAQSAMGKWWRVGRKHEQTISANRRTFC